MPQSAFVAFLRNFERAFLKEDEDTSNFLNFKVYNLYINLRS